MTKTEIFKQYYKDNPPLEEICNFLTIFFQRNTIAYLVVFMFSFIFFNYEDVEQAEVLKLILLPVGGMFLYSILATLIENKISTGNFSLDPVRNDNAQLVREKPYDMVERAKRLTSRDEMDEDILKVCSMHEAAHLLAYVRTDFEKYNKLEAYITRVHYNLGTKHHNNNIEDIYNRAFISYIPFVAEIKYSLASYENFIHQQDSQDFETYLKTYLYHSKKGYFLNPSNQMEIDHNISLLNKYKEKIELECREFLEEHETELFAVAEIIKERDIKTDEVKSILRRVKGL